jgi:hypothetical protein
MRVGFRPIRRFERVYVDHMPQIWRATVLVKNQTPAMQDVTVQADDAWHAECLIQQRYRNIIAGPSRVFTLPHLVDSYLQGSGDGRLASAASLARLSLTEFLLIALWIGAVAFFRSSGLSLLWATAGTGILLFSIVLRKYALHELRKRTKHFIDQKDL